MERKAFVLMHDTCWWFGQQPLPPSLVPSLDSWPFTITECLQMQLPFSPRDDPYTCQLISLSATLLFVHRINLDNLNYCCIILNSKLSPSLSPVSTLLRRFSIFIFTKINLCSQEELLHISFIFFYCRWNIVSFSSKFNSLKKIENFLFI